MVNRINNIHNLKQKVFWGLVACVCSLAGLYGYFVSASIVNIIIRGETENEIAALHSRIGSLEARYLGEKEIVTMELASAMGFRRAPGKTYVARESVLGRSLTFGNNEI